MTKDTAVGVTRPPTRAALRVQASACFLAARSKLKLVLELVAAEDSGSHLSSWGGLAKTQTHFSQGRFVGLFFSASALDRIRGITDLVLLGNLTES
ncbi:MAG TPA: hypothetical protein VFS12_18340 [Terriglobia bacterium]|nr:hypothetical protein [Terriglobia bacterium]